MLNKIRAYLSDPAHKKLLPFFIIIAIVVALPLTVFISQQDQDLHQRASETSSPVTQEALVHNTQDLEQLTDRLVKLNDNLKDNPQIQSLEEEDQRTVNFIQIAKKRKELLLQVIEKNPELFLAVAMDQEIQSSMPTFVQEHLEKEATVDAVIEVLHIDDFKNPENSKFNYFLILNGEQLNFYPTQDLFIASAAKVRVRGIKLEDNIVATLDKESFQVLAEAPEPESVGDQRTLVMLVRFQDAPPEPFTLEEAKSFIFDGPFNQFYKEQSYNKISFSGDVFGWFTLGNDPYIPCNLYNYLDKVLPRIFIDNNIDLGNYSRLVIMESTASGGCSTVGKISRYINSKLYRISVAMAGALGHNQTPDPFAWKSFDFALSHELGHSLGVLHANGWDCKDQSLSHDCTHIEYGNLFDTMGTGSHSLHFNAFYKELLGWINPSSALLINTSGNYTINPLETDSETKLAKIQIPGLNTIPFYLEYRKAIGFDSNLNSSYLSSNQSGLFVNYIKKDQIWGPYWGGFSSSLLDMSPTSKYWFEDISQVTLNDNNVFKNTNLGITIGPIIKTDESSITFNVKLEDPICTHNPPFMDPKYPFYSSYVTRASWGYVYVQFFNDDSAICGRSNFKLALTLPPNWTYIEPSNINLGPGEIGYFDIGFLVPEDADPDEYPIIFDITNLETGLKIHKEFKVTVYDTSRISRIEPSSGYPGQEIAIFGSSFSEPAIVNSIIFSHPQGYAYTSASEFSQLPNEQSLKFNVPLKLCVGGLGTPQLQGGGSCTGTINMPADNYSVYISGSHGTSNYINFRVTEPLPHAIKWKTDHVSLEADDFYIIANGKRYLAKDLNVNLNSSPPSPPNFATTTLEVQWNENSTEMRLNIYFKQQDGQWEVDEIRTYNGKKPGDWIYYSGGEISKIGSAFTAEKYNKQSNNGEGYINFGKIKLQPFLALPTPTLTPTPTRTPTPTPSICKDYGDVDLNGTVNATDTNLMLRYIVGSATFSSEQKKRADVNGDGKINVVDSILIQQYISKRITAFPVCNKPTSTPTLIPSSSSSSIKTTNVCTVCTADINKDGVVNLTDWKAITPVCYGRSTTTTPSCINADIDKSGTVNSVDLNCVARNYGKKCVK